MNVPQLYGHSLLLESLSPKGHCYNPGMIARTIAGVVAGDLIFILSTSLLFFFSRMDPHAPATLRFVLLSILCGVVFSLLGGFVAGWIGKRPDLIAGMMLAAIIAIPAAITFVMRPGEGAVWSQAAALFLMAPAALFGDWLRKSRRSAS